MDLASRDRPERRKDIMGASWSIETKTTAEFLALESEGAPSVHLTYSSSAEVAAMAPGLIENDECFWSIDAADVAAVAALLRLREGWKAEGVAEVCEAAARLGRGVTAA